MTYKIKGRTIVLPDAEIENLMKTLNISRNEAIDTWLSDNDYVSNETVETLTKNAKDNRITNSIHEARQSKENKGRRPREKKENPLKKQIIAGIHDYFLDEIGHIFPKNTEIIVTNDEKYIDLTIDNRHFTINLVEHREKKQK